MNELVLGRYGSQLLDLYPGALRGDLADSLEEICLDGVRLAREVIEAERRGVRFADAARGDEYPLIARVHFGLIDLLQLELPERQRAQLEEAIAQARAVEMDSLRRRWFLAAAGDDGDGDERELVGALMRFLLYQAVRLNVWLVTWDEGAPLEAAGALARLDHDAEATLRRRLPMVEMRDPEVRPLQVLVAEAVERLAAIWHDQRRELATSRPEVMELFDSLTDAAQIARDLGAGDAAILRNEIDGALGERQLESRALSERSPLALASQNATDQRRRRLLARLADGPPEPATSRLVDLLGELGRRH
jgi:hypothetical protein